MAKKQYPADQNEIQNQLLNFISTNFVVELNEIPLDKSLIDEGIIDSFGLIEISAFLESAFTIKVVQEDMIRENFGSVQKTVNFVSRKAWHERSI